MYSIDRARAGLVLLLIVSVLSACSNPPVRTPPASQATTQTASPEPASTSSTSPTGTPRPTPAADVAKLFVNRIAKDGLRGRGPISGIVTLGSLEVPVSGEIQLDGKDSVLTFTMDVPGGRHQTTSRVTAGGKTYESVDDGPWFEKKAVKGAAKPDTISSALGVAIMDVRDRGMVTKHGQPLHHLTPTGVTLTSADLGIPGPGASSTPATIEFFARDDGSLAVLSMGFAGTMEVEGSQIAVSMTIDFAFEEGAIPSVEAPTDLWVRLESKRLGYSIGYPKGWTAIKGKGDQPDVMGESDHEFTAVMRERQPKAAADDLAAYARAFIRATQDSSDSDPTADDPITLLGAPARRIEFELPMDVSDPDSDRLATVYTLLIRGRNGYWIGAFGPVEMRAEVVAFHDRQAATFQLLDD